MRRLIFAVVMLISVGISYGADTIVVPRGTTRIQNYPNGNRTFYDNRGMNGRSLYTGGGSSSLYGRNGYYMGRSQPTFNGGFRYTPAPYTQRLHNMPTTTRRR